MPERYGLLRNRSFGTPRRRTIRILAHSLSVAFQSRLLHHRVLVPSLIAVLFSLPYTVYAGVTAAGAAHRRGADPKRSLIPVPAPSLTNIEAIVQEQIRDAESKLNALLQQPDATADELSQAFGEMGKLYQAYDLKDAALACYLNAQSLDPGSFAWQYYAGYLYQAKGDLEQAAAYFNKALKVRPRDQPALLRLAQTDLDLSRPQLAKTVFQSVLTLDSSCAAAMAGLGKIALSERRYKDAIEYLKRALALQPDASSLNYQLALAYRGLGEVTEAQTYFLKQGANQPNFPDPLTRTVESLRKGKVALWMRGTQAIHEGRVTEAIENFRQMVVLDPKDPRALMYLGIALARAGDRDGAAQQFSKALQIAPQHAGVHYNFGALLTELGEEEEALKHFQAAVGANPQLTKARFQLANLLMRRGRYREAALEYDAVVRMEPRDGFARLMKAMALVRSREYSQARNELEMGRLALPHDTDLATALARLLAASPDSSIRDGRRALTMIQKVVSDERSLDLEQGQTLAMALAAAGEFQKAAQLQSTMITQLERDRRPDLARLLRANLALYQNGKRCLTPWRDDDPIFSPVPGKMGMSTDVSTPDLISKGSH
jgi:tetratricopeptide (TPR) repeat protein